MMSGKTWILTGIPLTEKDILAALCDNIAPVALL